jgi:hypothetical protein
MQHLAEVMFWKSVVLALWGVGQDAWERRKNRKLLERFQSEWNARRAKQPALLEFRKHGGG